MNVNNLLEYFTNISKIFYFGSVINALKDRSITLTEHEVEAILTLHLGRKPTLRELEDANYMSLQDQLAEVFLEVP